MANSHTWTSLVPRLIHVSRKDPFLRETLKTGMGLEKRLHLDLYTRSGYQLFFPRAGGEVCTSKAVPACSSGATGCNPIGKDNESLQAFIKDHPDVYAEECVDSGAQCLYTDVTYNVCAEAKASELIIAMNVISGCVHACIQASLLQI